MKYTCIYMKNIVSYLLNKLKEINMQFYSTRNINNKVKGHEAILSGIASDGGLYLPSTYLKFDLEKHLDDDYETLAFNILSYYFDEFDEAELKEAIHKAYTTFESKDVTPIVKCGDDYILELFHGPTCAFKDIALELLPHLLSMAIKLKNQDSLILTATSGDTGKAALAGFKDVGHTNLFVFYPLNGVSKAQERQMLTSEGQNVRVIGVKGNFDDCQKAVKQAMTSKELISYLEEYNLHFSSANSINIARLLPQCVYYFDAYYKLVKEGVINLYDKVNFTVPTGNFGNILAGYIASLMGLPVNKLIMASNRNNILYDFMNSGTYDTHRIFHKTNSPSMDIIVSSNLERLLSLLINDDHKLKRLMNDLNEKGIYTIDDTLKSKINDIFYAGFTDETSTVKTIRNCFDDYGYILDPHSAVGYKVMKEYPNPQKNINILLSTASPYKFKETIKEAGIALDMAKAPLSIKELDSKPVLHNINIEREDIIPCIRELIKTLK